ncbi:MAG TPA: carboxylesterase/lipase family protein [bacterium]|nr:carboxylesterase/lipase family protein [bacterium]
MAKYFFWGTAAIFLLVFSVFPVHADELTCSNVIETLHGSVSGMDAETPGVCAWLGIPYAAAPVGERRWRRPEKAEKWSGTLHADHYGSECVQLGALARGGRGKPKGSEDCLYLNVWRPEKSGVLPVMVWIHGGSLMMGSGSSAMYAGDVLAAKEDVVVVTINYRLGVMGFLADEDFQKEDAAGSVGGYGMMDQIAALTWVRDNIAAFGGDPENVTIFGESAGGWSVCNLMASPAAAGLFQRAIQESGGCNRTLTVEQGFTYGRELAAALGCKGPGAAECLRSKTAKEVMASAPWDATGRTSPFKPHEDGYLLKKMPIDHLRDGDYNHVPYLAGSNRDEYKIFLLLERDARNMDEKEYEARVRKEKGKYADEFLAAYPAAAFGSPGEAYVTMDGDRNPGCGAHDAVDAISRWQNDVYYYRFDFDDVPLGSTTGAFHALEVPFVFGTYDRGMVRTILGRKGVGLAAPVSAAMMDYWGNFAKQGDPNGPGLPEWPAYEGGERRRMVFDTEGPKVISEPAEQFQRCELWDWYIRKTERQGRKF